jgi:hypothetical protein
MKLTDGLCGREIYGDDKLSIDQYLARTGRLPNGKYCQLGASQWAIDRMSKCGCFVPAYETVYIFFETGRIKKIEVDRIFGVIF